MSNLSTIDLDTLNQLKEMMGADFIAELIDTYCEETPQLIAALQQALAQGDASVFQRTAHSIKSSSASLGAMDFSLAARELEMIGRSGNLGGAADAVERLATGYQQVQSRLLDLRTVG